MTKKIWARAHGRSGFTELQLRLITVLIEAGRPGMCRTEVISEVYRDDPEGGPDQDIAVIEYLRRKVNRRLKPYGIVIASIRKQNGERPYWRFEKEGR
jgi:hypothetical protein